MAQRLRINEKKLPTMKKLHTIILIFMTFAWFYESADAYVLQGPHILELMTKKLGVPERLLVSQRLIIFDNSLQNGSVELEETLRYHFPETFRSDIQSNNAQRIHVVSNGMALTVIDGKVSAEGETDFDLFKDILLFRSRELLHERLSMLGVDVSVSSLGRFKDKIVFIMGAEYPDESVPQIWIDKNNLRPIRWLIECNRPGLGKDSLEVRYLNWQKINKIWYPMLIEFYQNNFLVREINVVNFEVNPSFSENVFNIKHLKSIYPLVTNQLVDQEESNGENEVQKTIEDFSKIFK